LCLVYQKPEPQPTLHLIRMTDKSNDIPKKKTSLILRDVKTIDYAPVTHDKRQSSSLALDFQTADREYAFLVLTIEEKKEFLSNLRKVSSNRNECKSIVVEYYRSHC
jgi:hypothetical protein